MKARLRVLHCCYDDPDNPWVGGGGARRVFDLYRHLGDRVDATIATGSYPGARASDRDGLRVCRLGLPRPYALSRFTYTVAAARLLRRGGYDAAVVDYSAYAPVRIPRDRAVGITVHHLTGPVGRARWGSAIGSVIDRNERATLRGARIVSATSAATAQALRSIVGGATRIVRVASGVDDRFFAIERRSGNYVLYVGRLDASQKGVDLLLDAWAQVPEELRARLVIVGRGPDEALLKARAASLGVVGSVEFAGAISNEARNALMAGAACQVVPSRFEGFGIAAAEALAAGVPLVVSDDPALLEIAGEGAAVTVPREDPAALAKAIAQLLRDPSMRALLTRRARQRAEEFRWPAVAEAHLAYLCEIVAAHASLRGDGARVR
jgi:glycosyltransferase involved in cell wall biosynthesis